MNSKKGIKKELAKPPSRAKKKLMFSVVAAMLSTTPGCQGNAFFYEACDCSCKGEPDASPQNSSDSSKWTDAELGPCNPYALASGRTGIGEELELKKGILGFIVKVISIDLSNYEVTADILTLGGKESKKGVKIGMGEEIKEIVEVASGVKKQVTIGVCEEGTDSKGANLWATF